MSWIKMRSELSTDPAVVLISATTKLDRYSVVGRLHAIWSWADQHTATGNGLSVTKAFLDELAAFQGFADAMVLAGWLSGSDLNMSFPNFTVHNSESAKKRALTARRVSEHKSRKNAIVNAVVTLGALPLELPTTLPREEERRGDKSTEVPPPIPAPPQTALPPKAEPPAASKARPSCEDDVIDFAVSLGLPENDGRYFWEKWHGSGFKNGSKPILDWKATIRSWKLAGHCPSQKNQTATKRPQPYANSGLYAEMRDCTGGKSAGR